MAWLRDLIGRTRKVGIEDVEFGRGTEDDTFDVATSEGGTASRRRVPSLLPETASVIKGVYYVSNSTSITDHSATSGADYEAMNFTAVLDLIGSDTVTLKIPPGTYNFGGNTIVIPSNIIVDAEPGVRISDGILTVNGAHIRRHFAPTLALAQAFIFSFDGQSCEILGRTVPGDGYFDVFQWSASDLEDEVANDPLHGVYVPPNRDLTGKTGGLVRVNKKYITPEMFGAQGDDETDDGLSWAAMMNFAAYFGVRKVQGGAGKTYLFFSGTSYSHIFSGTLENIEINGNMCQLHLDESNTYYDTTPHSGQIFYLDNPKNIIIDKFWIKGASRSASFVQGSYSGIDFVRIHNGGDKISLPFNIVDGAGLGVHIGDLADTAQVDNVHIGDLYVSNAWYGVEGSAIGKNLKIDSLVTKNVYRSFFPTAYAGDILNAKVNITSTNPQGFVDAYLKIRETRAINGLALNYNFNAESIDVGCNTRIVLLYESLSGDPCYARDIRININGEYASTGDTGFNLFGIWKFLSESEEDETDRGHVLDGLKVSGIVKGTPSIAGNSIIGSGYSTYGYFGPGDFWNNVRFENLYLDNAASRIYILTDAIEKSMVLDQLNSAGVVHINTSSSRYGACQKGAVIARNCCFPNQYDNTANVMIGYIDPYPSGTPLSVPDGWVGRPIINKTINTATYFFNLPAAGVGKEFPFMRYAAGGMRIYPDGTDTIRNEGGGGYLNLTSQGDMVTLRCFTPGIWDITSHVGVYTLP